ncbi:MAG: hypothetical protein Q9164_003100 [Protoblastenia rupestris]
MGLLDLPPEILMLLPYHLRNIEDFKEASSSCRSLRNAFLTTSPNTILRLAAESSRNFFRPHPYFLVAATVRQISDWAFLSPENTATLRKAFKGGIDGLFDLCISKASLTMDDIRRLHASRFSTINPLYETPNFWHGGVSDAATIDVEPQRSLFQIVIYGELFKSSVQAVMEGGVGFDLGTRLDYIKYCIPDSACWSWYGDVTVEKVGPYANAPKFINPDGDQVGLQHILTCSTWKKAWRVVQQEIGADFEEAWRQKIWYSVLQMQGLEGLEMLRPGGVEKWRTRLQEKRNKIAAMSLENQPQIQMFGHRMSNGSDCPSMADEVYVCMCGYWPG